jgi:WS/DGAT/MGAT family acyltransferase
MWFITGLPERRVAVLIVVHHALADGLAAMRLGLSLLEAPLSGAGNDGDTRAAPPAAPSPPRGRDLVRDNARLLLDSASGLVRPETWRAIGSTLRSFRAGWTVTRHEPRTSLNAQVGPRRRTTALRLDAAAAKRVARAHGVGVNEVVLDLVAGGVRALLASRGEPVERLAPRAGIAVTLAPSRRGDAGNHFGSYTVALPLRHADPVARLPRIRSGWERAKRTQSVTGVTGIRVWTARFGPTRYVMGRQRFINLMETYLPGPPRPISLLGARVLDLIPIQPLGRNVGLTFLASSYAGRLTVTVRSDPERFPDLDVLMRAMERDWDALSGPDVGATGATVSRPRGDRRPPS